MSWKRAKTSRVGAVERNSLKSLETGQTLPEKTILPHHRHSSPCNNAYVPENDQCGHFWVNSSSRRLDNWLTTFPSGNALGFTGGCCFNCIDLPYALRKENNTSSSGICIQTPKGTCEQAHRVFRGLSCAKQWQIYFSSMRCVAGESFCACQIKSAVAS